MQSYNFSLLEDDTDWLRLTVGGKVVGFISKEIQYAAYQMVRYVQCKHMSYSKNEDGTLTCLDCRGVAQGSAGPWKTMVEV